MLFRSTVWNDGLRKVLNLLPGVDMPRASVIQVPMAPGRQTGRGSSGGMGANVGFAEGGWTGPGGKYQPAGIVHADEHVWTKEESRRFPGGHRGLERLRKAVAAGDFHLPGYAVGGVVRPVPQASSGWNGGRYRSGGYHGGLDFPAPTGTPISSMWAGRVSRALRLNRSYGHHAIVDHGGGLQTLYAHMSQLLVNGGQSVGAGSLLGRVGSTGNSTGPHLHLEVRRNGVRVNPEPYLSGAKAGGAGLVPDGNGGFIDLLTKLPSMLGSIRDSLGQLSGGWGAMFLGAAKEAIANVVSYAVEKVPVLGPALKAFTGEGFAGGTSYAPPGLSWVGERGPELVNFRGGERVYNAAESARMAGGRPLVVNLNIDGSTVRTIGDLASLIGNAERYALQHSPELAPVGGY